MYKIKFIIQESNAPYPHQCWWKIVGSNGRIMVVSELMSRRAARKAIAKVAAAIKAGKYSLPVFK